MKAPYLNQEQRMMARSDTPAGALLRLHLALKLFERTAGRLLRLKEIVEWISNRL